MKRTHNYTLIFIIIFVCAIPAPAQTGGLYTWKKGSGETNSLRNFVTVPPGYRRMSTPAGSFAEWLRGLPLKKKGTPVYLYNGSLKRNQQAHYAVVDIDTGNRDLQQCADAVMRLRAEYFFSRREYTNIQFNITNGDTVTFSKWAEGFRPSVKGNRVYWSKKAAKGTDYAIFMEYMTFIFSYAGTHSLSLEMKAVPVTDMRTGDVFIQGGFPGHAVIVLDMAEKATGERIFLLGQSYMPAQDFHILRNPMNRALSPWYTADFGEVLITPEWKFSRNSLKRF